MQRTDSNLNEHIKMEMLNSIRSPQIVDELMKALVELTPMLDKEKYRFRVAISEIVTNSYLHGNQQNPERTIWISILILTNRIEIVVEDEGDGFTESAISRKYESDGIYASGGRGIKIAQKIADKIEWYHTDRGTFAVSVCKYYKLPNEEAVESVKVKV
ncbi:MAG: hypothetical protein GF315_02265 [candidate division Zixibacteria bacterium]|nr:hypothetical protein [candidate division Zixibacteria bacterium]